VRNLVVIPAFNEEEALPAVLASLQSALPTGYEIAVVDDGSHDRTAEVCTSAARKSRLPITLLRLTANSGIGAAVQTGYRFAALDGGYDHVIQFDADGQHDAREIPLLVEASRQRQLDLCIGSRFLHPGAERFRSTVLRRVGIRFFCRLIRLLSGTRVTDPTSGFRCTGPRAWKQFALSYPDDYPEPESLFWCARHGLRVGEVAVRMQPRQGGVTSIRSVRVVYYMVKVSLAILVDWLRAREELLT
jgi:glycosyltransferase involved in cell wall biosynthesis